MTAWGNIAITGTNVRIDASTVSADGTLYVMAHNDLSIVAGAENSSYSYQSSSGGGDFFGSSKSESLDESHLTYQESILSSGDDMSLNAMGNIGIAGSEVESG
ncbi:hemagglutinin repeat-containing protein [Thalassospira lucentensis]|uniref:hemagglutinin repeat-containing protein n=1 Tax=Thalassospira lucentensis TaxID=168935 RepID=UPI0023F32165|nr:hemagglutinin repeat-containing protein [Thalassospira lucentensis]